MRLLRKVDICGRTFEVIEATPEENAELVDLDGLCDSNAAIIWITAGKAETVQVDTLVHEIMHGAIEATGLRTRFATADEEDVVTTLTPALRAALKSAGWREPKRVGKAPRKPRAAKVVPVSSVATSDT